MLFCYLNKHYCFTIGKLRKVSPGFHVDSILDSRALIINIGFGITRLSFRGKTLSFSLKDFILGKEVVTEKQCGDIEEVKTSEGLYKCYPTVRIFSRRWSKKEERGLYTFLEAPFDIKKINRNLLSVKGDHAIEAIKSINVIYTIVSEMKREMEEVKKGVPECESSKSKEVT